MTGALTLLRFHLRRDRWMLLGWIGAIVVLYWSQAVSIVGLYPTQADLDRAAASLEGNAAFVAMAGPAVALDTVGGQIAFQMAAFGAVMTALMSMFLTTRHTRAEEDSGRDELLRAAAVGRYAPLTATVVLVVLANMLVTVGVITSLAPYAPLAGALALGVGAGLNGLFFGGVALVAAQVADGARTANGIAGGLLGVAYGVRAVGDVAGGGLSWASPIGWAQGMRPYADERWWPVVLFVIGIGVLGVAAVMMLDRRDLGSGLRGTRPGPARGRLGSVGALAWRLQRTSIVAWVAAMFVFGSAYGSIGDGAGDLVGDSDLGNEVFAQGGSPITEAFFGVAALMLAVIGSAFVVTSVLRLRGEEADGHAEVLLATATSRRRWAVSHLVPSAVGGVLVVAAAGVGLALGYASTTGAWSRFGELAAAVTQHGAAVLVLAAATFVLHAASARLGRLAWALLAYAAIVLVFGQVLRLPEWLMDVSPFHHLALMPSEPFEIAPLLALLAAAAALTVLGDTLLRRRDIT